MGPRKAAIIVFKCSVGVLKILENPLLHVDFKSVKEVAGIEHKVMGLIRSPITSILSCF